MSDETPIEVDDRLSPWTGRFVDPAREREYQQTFDRNYYRAIVVLLGAVALLPLVAIVGEYFRLGGFVWPFVAMRIAMALSILSVILAARKSTSGGWFAAAVWVLCGILVFANVKIINQGAILWEVYTTTMALEIFAIAFVLWRRPVLAYSVAAVLLTAFVVHGAIEVADRQVVRLAFLLMGIAGIALEFVRRNSLTSREIFGVQQKGQRAQADLQMMNLDLTSEKDAVEEAASKNIELVEELYGMRQHAEEQAGSLRVILNTLMQGVTVFDADLRLRMCNDRFPDLLDLPDGFVETERSLDDFIHFYAERGDYGEGDPAVLAANRIRAVRASDASRDYKYERLIGTERVLEVEGRGLPDGGVVTTYTDITERKKAEGKIQHMALHDALTGLKNRRGFTEILHEAAQGATGRGSTVGLAMLDLDGFKQVNDMHGHPMGDALLQRVSQIITDAVRAGDCVARIGGDEFAIVFTTVQNIADAQAASNRIINQLKQPIMIDGIALHVGTSVGLGFYPTDADTVDGFVETVDAALYKAKNAGKGRLITVAA